MSGASIRQGWAKFFKNTSAEVEDAVDKAHRTEIWNSSDAAIGYYDINSLVSYSGYIWRSTVDNNTDTPAVGSDWERYENELTSLLDIMVGVEDLDGALIAIDFMASPLVWDFS